MKTTYVVFPKNIEGARILVNPDGLTLGAYQKSGAMILKNPTRVNLNGIPPHLWRAVPQRNEVHPVENAQARKNDFTPTPILPDLKPQQAQPVQISKFGMFFTSREFTLALFAIFVSSMITFFTIYIIKH